MRYHLKLYPKKDARYPGILSIYVRINVASKVAYHFTGIRLKPNQWDEKKNMVKPSVAGSQKIREALESMMVMFENAALDFVSVGKPFTAIMIKDRALSSGRENLGYILEKILAYYESEQQFSEIVLVKQAIKRLGSFGELERIVGELNSFWFEAFAKKMEISGNNASSIRVRVSELNKYLKLASRLGLCEYDDKFYRFAKLPKHKSAEKAYLNLEEIDLIYDYWRSLQGHNKHLVGAYLISFYLYGLRISDVLSLTRNQLDGTDKIKIIERKTKKVKIVPIPDRCQEIIEATLSEKFWINPDHPYYGSHFILPLLRHYVIRGNSKEAVEFAQKNEIIYKTKCINDYLKFALPKLGIHGKITCHTARHSFAVLASTIHKDDIRLVQQLLNHSNMRTTELYLHSIEDSRLDNAARKIFKVS